MRAYWIGNMFIPEEAATTKTKESQEAIILEIERTVLYNDEDYIPIINDPLGIREGNIISVLGILGNVRVLKVISI